MRLLSVVTIREEAALDAALGAPADGILFSVATTSRPVEALRDTARGLKATSRYSNAINRP